MLKASFVIAGLVLASTQARAEVLTFTGNTGSMNIGDLTARVTRAAGEPMQFQGYDSATKTAFFAGARQKFCKVQGELVAQISGGSALVGAQRKVDSFFTPTMKVGVNTETNRLTDGPSMSISCE